MADKAVSAAVEKFEEWKWVDPRKRAGFLFKAAASMRRRKHEFSAVMIEEVGKTWPEADADTAEAIDFLEFYAREMLRYSVRQTVTRISSEKNELIYIPLGAGVVVPPWNFALAILAGMTSAAVVTGNTVVLKPSSDSPLTGWMFFQLMREAGLPNGVINFVTGSGGADRRCAGSVIRRLASFLLPDRRKSAFISTNLPHVFSPDNDGLNVSLPRWEEKMPSSSTKKPI